MLLILLSQTLFGKTGIILVPNFSDGAVETIKMQQDGCKDGASALSNSQQTLAVIILVQLLYFTEENIKVKEYEVLVKVPPTQ